MCAKRYAAWFDHGDEDAVAGSGDEEEDDGDDDDGEDGDDDEGEADEEEDEDGSREVDLLDSDDDIRPSASKRKPIAQKQVCRIFITT